MSIVRRPSVSRIALLYLAPIAAGCGAAVERPGFEATVSGAVETTVRGSITFTPGALTLSAGDSGGTLVFTDSDGAELDAGTYHVGGTDDRRRPRSLVNALFIAGPPSRPVGVFRGSAGALTVTTATHERIAGRFDLDAVGVLTDGNQTRADSASVQISGSFLVLEPCIAATSQAAAPCARQSRRAAEVRLHLTPSESTTRSRN